MRPRDGEVAVEGCSHVQKETCPCCGQRPGTLAQLWTAVRHQEQLRRVVTAFAEATWQDERFLRSFLFFAKMGRLEEGLVEETTPVVAQDVSWHDNSSSGCDSM